MLNANALETSAQVAGTFTSALRSFKTLIAPGGHACARPSCYATGRSYTPVMQIFV